MVMRSGQYHHAIREKKTGVGEEQDRVAMATVTPMISKELMRKIRLESLRENSVQLTSMP